MLYSKYVVLKYAKYFSNDYKINYLLKKVPSNIMWVTSLFQDISPNAITLLELMDRIQVARPILLIPPNIYPFNIGEILKKGVLISWKIKQA